MTSKLTITRERMEEIILDNSASLEEFMAITRMALSAMDSEPVADVVAWSHPTEERTCDIRWRRHDVEPGPLYRHAQPAPKTEREPIAWLNDAYLARGVVDGEAGSEDAGPGYIPVYREASPAQPVPVVPDEMTKSLTLIAKEYQTTPQNALFIVVGWNACRAAMLQELQKSAGEPNNCRSNENVQVMQNVSRCSNKAAPALDSSPKTAELRCGNSPLIPDCWCRNCRPLVLNDMRFVVCPDCGNKRCPKANDHRNDCSGSNEPGQEGSAYPAAPQEVQGE